MTTDVTANTISKIQSILASHEPKSWTVIVCPDDSVFWKTVEQFAESLFPHGADWCGRTAILPNRGRLTVVVVSVDPTTFKDPFDVCFCGWDDDLVADNRKMADWRQRAVRVVE